MGIWAEIKKAINSDFLNEPLNVKTDRIEADTQDIQTKVNILDTVADRIEVDTQDIQNKVNILDTVADRIELDTISIETKVDTANTNIGSNADASSASGSVHAKLKDLKAYGNIKSIQTGFTNAGALSTGSGEDTKYIDIIISAVTISKSMLIFEGGFAGTLGTTMAKSGSDTAGDATLRLTSTTNIRIATTYNSIYVAGRWTVIEFN